MQLVWCCDEEEFFFDWVKMQPAEQIFAVLELHLVEIYFQTKTKILSIPPNNVSREKKDFLLQKRCHRLFVSIEQEKNG